MKRPTTRPFALTRLHLENWRNFAQVDVALQRRTFVIGPNASGKSNLLDVFRFLYDIVSIGGGFEEAVRRRGGVSSLRCLAARRYSDVLIRATIGREGSPTEWEYELSFNQDNLRRPVIKREVVHHEGKLVLTRPNDDDNRDPERLTQTYLQQINVNQSFRDVADFFRSVRYLHIVPQLVREPDRSVGKTNDPFGGDFLEQIAKTPEKTRASRLRRIEQVLKVALPQLKALELWRDVGGTPHLRGKYEHWRPQGAWQTEDKFSDGTLRLMGLLWAILDGTGPLLLEEPELSLHPEVVRYVPQMFARIQRALGRQILISTHSMNLLEDVGIGLDEVLLLGPGENGTEVRLASEAAETKALVEKGLPLGEVLMPQTKPAEAYQLSLFDARPTKQL